MFNRWVYEQRDGSLLYGVHRPESPRVRTAVHYERDDTVWDRLEAEYDNDNPGEYVHTPPVDPPMGAYL